VASSKKPEAPAPGAPAWMATFGDLMSLLLTFFILIVSFSSMQESKFQEAVGSLQGALGVLKDLPSVPIHEEIMRREGRQDQAREISERVQELEEAFATIPEAEVVEVSRTERGLSIRIEAQALFDLGQAELRSEARPILDKIADALAGLPHPVRIEGHTDNIPLTSGRFPSNWELSAARAAAVLRHLEGRGVDARRLSAVGYGEWRPVVENDTDEHRQQNRRVEIFMEPPPRAQPARLGEHL
jgi:chemotaxis protein MotB